MDQTNCFCPFRHCTQHSKADKPKGFTDTQLLRQHFCDVHKQSLCELADPTLNKYNIHVCRQCGGYATCSKTLLNSHQLIYVKRRSTSNYNLVTTLMYEGINHVQKTTGRKAYCTSPTTPPPQPEFRSTLITQISFRLEREFLRTYHAVLKCCTEVMKTPNNDDLDDNKPTPTWLLAFVFEILVLGPNQDPMCSINKTVHQRMRLFRSGQISLLF